MLAPSILYICSPTSRHGRGVMADQNIIQSNGIASSSATPLRLGGLLTRRAKCRTPVIFIRTASSQIVIANETGFNTVEERLEVEKAGSCDTETFGDLGAHSHRPRIKTRRLQLLRLIPEDELAHSSSDRPSHLLVSSNLSSITDLRDAEKEE